MSAPTVAGRLTLPAPTTERWAPEVASRREQEQADDYREHNGLTADHVVVDADRFTRELLAWADHNGSSNLRPGDVLTMLADLGEPVEQAEDETAGYREPDTGAFVGSRRTRYVGTWEEA